jgi:hypothetical protein
MTPGPIFGGFTASAFGSFDRSKDSVSGDPCVGTGRLTTREPHGVLAVHSGWGAPGSPVHVTHASHPRMTAIRRLALAVRGR